MQERVPDFALISDTLPVPTVATPTNAPSPSHERPSPPPSPPPIPVPDPNRSEDPIPIPIHEAPHSPVHPPYFEPPDNWIPYAKDNDVSSIEIPPPHEFIRPVSPVVEPSPARSEAPLPVAPPVPEKPSMPSYPRDEPRQDARYDPSVRSRDYAYNAASTSYKPPPPSSMRSPQSRTSTRISEYDIVAPPRVYRQGVDRESLSGPQQIYRESVSFLVDSGYCTPAYVRLTLFSLRLRLVAAAGSRLSPGNASTLEQVLQTTAPARRTSDAAAPTEAMCCSGSSASAPRAACRLRRTRTSTRSRRSTSSLPYALHPLLVGPPRTERRDLQSTDASPQSSSQAETAPHLLSPEHAHHALPSLAHILGPHEHAPSPLTAPPAVPETQVYTMYTPGARYAEAPVPSSVVYPAPPGRTASRASVTRPPTAQSGSTVDSGSLKSRRRQGSLGDNFSGRLSPLSSIGMPFSSFAMPDGQ